MVYYVDMNHSAIVCAFERGFQKRAEEVVPMPGVDPRVLYTNESRGAPDIMRLTNSIGMLGPGQLDPRTARETAAKMVALGLLPGIPTDKELLDPRKNFAIGSFYSTNMLPKLRQHYQIPEFTSLPPRPGATGAPPTVPTEALMYNAGPGRVSGLYKQHGTNWLANAPSETRGYAEKYLTNLNNPSNVRSHFERMGLSDLVSDLPKPPILPKSFALTSPKAFGHASTNNNAAAASELLNDNAYRANPNAGRSKQLSVLSKLLTERSKETNNPALPKN